jgi:hypothetical protein
MNKISPDQFDEINSILERCAKASVGFVLHWSEAEDAWWSEVCSSAPSENYVSKTYSLTGVINMTNEWLDKISR